MLVQILPIKQGSLIKVRKYLELNIDKKLSSLFHSLPYSLRCNFGKGNRSKPNNLGGLDQQIEIQIGDDGIVRHSDAPGWSVHAATNTRGFP